LEGTNLVEADPGKAILVDASLSHVNFSGAFLYETDLESAHLREAVLDPGKWKTGLAGGAQISLDRKVIIATSNQVTYSPGSVDPT
jgi:uncharacterized protein YjbI with pentapeptide repeats